MKQIKVLLIHLTKPTQLLEQITKRLYKEYDITLEEIEEDIIYAFFDDIIKAGPGDHLITRFGFMREAKKTPYIDEIRKLISTEEEISKVRNVNKVVNAVLDKFKIDSIPYQKNMYYIITEKMMRQLH